MRDDENETYDDETFDVDNFLSNIRMFIETYGQLDEKQGRDKDLPFTHFLAALIMEVFDPGFVIIGSPILDKLDSGRSIPKDLGMVVNSDTDLTISDVAAVLHDLGAAVIEKVDESLNIEHITEGTPND